MIRFKVVKGSHLLLAFAVIVLLAVVAFILLQGGASDRFSAETNIPGAEIVQTNESEAEAKAAIALASNAFPAALQIEVVADAPSAAPLADAPTILIYHPMRPSKPGARSTRRTASCALAPLWRTR